MDAPLEPWFLNRLKREGWKSDAQLGDATRRSNLTTHHSSTDANGGSHVIQLSDLESNVTGASSRHQEASTTSPEVARAPRQAGLLGKMREFPDPAGPFLWKSFLLLLSVVSIFATTFAVIQAIGGDIAAFNAILVPLLIAYTLVSIGGSSVSGWKAGNR